jgi:hypothetical protein
MGTVYEEKKLLFVNLFTILIAIQIHCVKPQNNSKNLLIGG